MMEDYIVAFKVDRFFVLDLEKLREQLNLTRFELLREALDRMREQYLGVNARRDIVIVNRRALEWLVRQAEANKNLAQKKQIRKIVGMYTRKGKLEDDEEKAIILRKKLL